MPFITQSTDRSLIKPATRSGRLSAAPKSDSRSPTRMRPQSQLSFAPNYEDDPASRLYSSPAPRLEPDEQFDASHDDFAASPLQRPHTARNLLVPLEVAHETAFARRGERENETMRDAKIGRLGSAMRQKLEVQGYSVKIPELPRTGDRAKLGSQQQKQYTEIAPSVDKRKRLEEQTRQELAKVKPSRSMSAFGRQMDIRSVAQQITIPKAKNAIDIAVKPPQRRVSEWIVQQRAGQFGPAKPKVEQIAADDFEKKREEAVRQKQFVDGIVITASEVLPIFKCVAQKIEIQRLLDRQCPPSEIADYMRRHGIKDASNAFLEQQMIDVDQRRREVLQIAPEIVSAGLKQNEFLYLTYDTPEIRKKIINDYLKKENPPIYQQLDPRWNPYELIVCNFEQINRDSYFTMSGSGVSYIGLENWMVPLRDWEDERNKYINMRKMRLAKEFMLRKSMQTWKNTILEARKHRSLMIIMRISLLANQKYIQTVKQVNEAIRFDFQMLRQQIFTFILPNDLMRDLGQQSKYPNQVQRLEQVFRTKFVSIPVTPISFKQFVADWRSDLIQLKQYANDKIEQVSDVLLKQCQEIQQQIQERIMTQLDKKQKNASAAVLQQVANASTYNISKMRSLVRLADYQLLEREVEYLIQVNQDLYAILFGQVIPIIPEDKDIVVEKQQKIPEALQQFYKKTEVVKVKTEKDIEKLQKFIESIDLEKIASTEQRADTQTIRFSKNIKQSESTELPREENDLLVLLSEKQREQYKAFKPWFTDVPLVLLEGYYPAQPIWVVNFVLEQGKVADKPNEQDFIKFLGDCLAELATVFQKALRPHLSQRLQSLLMEATRSQQIDLCKAQIKEMIAVSEDYISSVQQLKWGLQFAYGQVQRYKNGVNLIVIDVVNVLSAFVFGEDRQQLERPLDSYIYQALRRDEPDFQFQEFAQQKTLCLLKELDASSVAQMIIFFEQIVFPDLQKQEFDVLELPHFEKTYFEEIVHQCRDYRTMVSLLTADQFSRRLQQLQNLIFTVKKLDCKRAIMCFEVSSQQIYKDLKPFLMKQIEFCRMTLVISIVAAAESLKQQLNEYCNILGNIPENVFEVQKDYIFPSMVEYSESLLDSSLLLNTGIQQYISEANMLKEQLRTSILAFNEAIVRSERVKKMLEKEKKLAAASHKQNKKDKKKTGRLDKQDKDKPDVLVEEERDDVENLQVIDVIESDHSEDNTAVEDKSQETRKSLHRFYFNKTRAPSEQSQMLERLLKEQINLNLLQDTQKTLEIFDLARSQFGMFKEFNLKFEALRRVGIDLGILNDGDRINCNTHGEIFLDRYSIPHETSVKEQTTTYYQTVLKLDKLINQFTTKKQNFYIFFQRSLLIQYLQLQKQVFDLMYQVIFIGRDLFYEQGVVENKINITYLKGEKLTAFETQGIKTSSELYLYLLLQQKFGLNSVKNQLFELQVMRETYEQLNVESQKLSQTILLFETTDFYPDPDEKITEIQHVLQFIDYQISEKCGFWQALQSVEQLIKDELCKPIAICDIEKVQSVLKQADNQIIQFQCNIQATQYSAQKCLESLRVELRAVREVQSKMYIDVQQDNIRPYISFSVLKYLMFCYKKHSKYLQMQVEQLKYGGRSKEIEIIINSIKSETEQLNESLSTSFIIPEYQDNIEEVGFMAADFDELHFVSSVSDSILLFLSQFDLIINFLELTKQLESDVPRLGHLKQVCFQGKHFKEIARVIPSPDLVLEIEIFDLLVNTPEKLFKNISDFLQQDKDNAYRQLFGPGHDGIQELLLYGIVLQSRKEMADKQYRQLGLTPKIQFGEVISTIHEIETKYLGYELQYFNERKQVKDDMATLRAETDTENNQDQEQIESKAQIHQSMMSSIPIHLEAIITRLKEILYRRKTKKRNSIEISTETVKYSIEFDRFSISISRLVFHGIYSKNKLPEIFDIIDRVQKEFGLLNELAKIKTDVNKQRISIRLLSTDEESKLYLISDATQQINYIQDKLIQMQALKTLCTRYKDKNVTVATKILTDLEANCEQALRTITDIQLYQTTYTELSTAFGSINQISKTLVEETRLFQRTSKMYQNELVKINENGNNFVKSCSSDLQQLIRGKLAPDAEQLEKALQKYMLSKRITFPRFWFMSERTLCRLLSLQMDVQYVSQSIVIASDCLQQIFGGLQTLKIDVADEKKIALIGIEAIDGEKLLVKPITLRQSVESWVSSLSVAAQLQLKQHFRDYFQVAMHQYETYMTTDPLSFDVAKLPKIDEIPVQAVYLAKACVAQKLVQKYGTDAVLKLWQRAVITGAATVKNRKTKLECTRQQFLLAGDYRILQMIEMNDLYYRYDENQDIVVLCDTITSKQRSTTLANYCGLQYKFEFFGATQRMVITSNSMKIMKNLVYESCNYIVGSVGIGKSTTSKELFNMAGQFSYTFICQQQISMDLVYNSLRATCQDGCGLIFDDVCELNVDVISGLAIIMSDLIRALQTHTAKLIINQQQVQLQQSARIILNSHQNINVSLLQKSSRVLQLLRPDSKQILFESMACIGIITAESVAVKASSFFDIFFESTNFRTIKQFLILLSIQYPRFIAKISKNDYINELLKSAISPKQIKEQQQFCYFIDQFVICLCIVNMIQPSLNSDEIDKFKLVLTSSFTKEIVDQILKSTAQNLQVNVRSYAISQSGIEFDQRKVALGTQIGIKTLLVKDCFIDNLDMLIQNINFATLLSDKQDLDIDSAFMTSTPSLKNFARSQTPKQFQISPKMFDQNAVDRAQEKMPEVTAQKAETYIIQNLDVQIAKAQLNYLEATIQNYKYVIGDQLDRFVLLEQSLWIRTGIIIVGATQSGKTNLWKNMFDRTNSTIILNSKMEQYELFGVMKDNYFIEGIIPQTLRSFSQRKIDEKQIKSTTSYLNFIVFQGSIEKRIGEQLYSALDDSKTLELENGERLRIRPTTKFIFEVDTLENLDPAFLSRCSVVYVNQAAEIWKVMLMNKSKTLFPQDYLEFQTDFKFDENKLDFTYPKQIETQVHVQQRYNKVRRITKDDMIKENVAKYVNNYYQYNANYYVNLIIYFSEIITKVQQIYEKIQQKFDSVKFVTQIFDSFKIMAIVVLKYDQKNKHIILRHLRSYLLYCFLYYLKANNLLNSQPFSQLLVELTLNEYRKLQELNQIELLPDIQSSYYCEKTYVPEKMMDHKSQFALTDGNSNSFGEYDIVSSDFCPRTGEYLIQTQSFKEQAILMFHAMNHRQSIQITNDLEPILKNHLIITNNQFLEVKSKLINRQMFLQIIKNCYVIEGNSLIPKVPIIFIMYDFDEASIDLKQEIKYILEWQKISMQVGYYIKQFDLTNICFVLLASNYYNLPQLNSAQSIDNQLFLSTKASILIWSAQLKINSTILPLFTQLTLFLQDVFDLTRSQQQLFDFYRAKQVIKSITQFSENAMNKYIESMQDANAIIPVKRYFFASICYIIRTEYFIPQNMSEKTQLHILQTLAEKHFTKQIAELKPANGIKGKAYLHPELIFSPFYSCLSIDQVNKDLKTYCETLPNFDRTLVSNSVQDNQDLLYVESEWEKTTMENIDLSQKLPEKIKIQPSSFNSIFQIGSDSKTPEICDRFQQIVYALATRRYIVTGSQQIEITQTLYSKAAYFCGMKPVIITPNSDQFKLEAIIRIQQQILYILELVSRREPIYRQVLIFGSQFTSNESSANFLAELIESDCANNEIFSEHIIEQCRSAYQLESKVSQFEIIKIIEMIIRKTFYFAIITQQQNQQRFLKLKHLIFYERQKRWQLASVALEGHKMVFKKEALKDYENVFTSAKESFVTVFKFVVQALSKTSDAQLAFSNPSFFSRFVESALSIYVQRKQIIGADRSQLMKALDTFKATQAKIEKMQQKVMELKPKLMDEQQKLLDLQITDSQQKKVAEQLQAHIAAEQVFLQMQLKNLMQEKGEADAQLAEVQPIMDEAQRSLQQLTRNEAIELGAIQNPSAQIMAVATALCTLLQENTAWTHAKIVIGKGDFLSRIGKLNPSDIPPKIAKQFKILVESPDFDIEKIMTSSKAAGTLAAWAVAFQRFGEIKEKADPKLKRAQQLQEICDEKEQGLQQKEDQLAETRMQIAQLIMAVTHHTNAINALQAELKILESDLSLMLQVSLLVQRQARKWEEEVAIIDEQQNNLTTLSIAMAADFLLSMDQENVVDNRQKLFELLNSFGVVNITIGSLLRFAADEETQLSLVQFAPTSDEHTKMSLARVLLNTYSCVFLDPDDQFSSFIKYASEGHQPVVYLQGSSNNLSKLLEESMRAGDACIVYCNVNQIPQMVLQLNQFIKCDIVNLTEQKNAVEMVSISICEKKYDISTRFQLFIIDKENKFSSINADILSSCSIHSFQKQKTTIGKQLASVITQIECADLKEQYRTLITKQADCAREKKECELAIIQSLLGISEDTLQQLVSELQIIVNKQNDLEQSVIIADSIEKTIQAKESEYTTDVDELTGLYLVLQKSFSFSLNVFFKYIQQFWKEGVQKLVEYISLNLTTAQLKTLKLMRGFRNEIAADASPVLLQTIQKMLVTENHYVIYQNGKMTTAKYQFDFQSDVLRAPSEQVSVVELSRRRTILGLLVLGMFKTEPPKTDQAPPERLLKAPFDVYNKFCRNDLVDVHPTLQQQIVSSVERSFKNVIIPLLQKKNVKFNVQLLVEQITSGLTLSNAIADSLTQLMYKLFDPDAMEEPNVTVASIPLSAVCRKIDRIQLVYAQADPLEIASAAAADCGLELSQNVNEAAGAVLVYNTQDFERAKAQLVIFATNTANRLFPAYVVRDFSLVEQAMYFKLNAERRIMAVAGRQVSLQKETETIVRCLEAVQASGRLAKRVSVAEIRQAFTALVDVVLNTGKATTSDIYERLMFLTGLMLCSGDRSSIKYIFENTKPVIERSDVFQAIKFQQNLIQVTEVVQKQDSQREAEPYRLFLRQSLLESTVDEATHAVELIGGAKTAKLALIHDVARFFNYLVLQAVHLYGGVAADYTLVTGPEGGDMDLWVELTLMNVDSSGSSKTAKHRIAAQRMFKRRSLNLPLLGVIDVVPKDTLLNLSAEDISYQESTLARSASGTGLVAMDRFERRLNQFLTDKTAVYKEMKVVPLIRSGEQVAELLLPEGKDGVTGML